MLQVIGLIGCFMLFLRGWEMFSQSHSNKVLRIGGIIALCGSAVFALVVMRTFALETDNAYTKCVLRSDAATMSGC